MSSPVIPTQFTRQDFMRETLNMRELMGSPAFWAKDSATRQAALHGYSHVFFNSDLSEQDMSTYHSTLFEFTKREGMMALAGKLGA